MSGPKNDDDGYKWNLMVFKLQRASVAKDVMVAMVRRGAYDVEYMANFSVQSADELIRRLERK
jgi:hypothetical protein